MNPEAQSPTPDPAKKPKHAGGAPKKVTKEVAGKIFELIALGMSEERVAHVLGINKATIFRAKANAEFCGALMAVKEAADKKVVESLFHRAIGYSHPEEKLFCHEGKILRAETTKHYPPDVGAATLWLINRQRDVWRKEIQKEENRPNEKAPMIRLISRVSGKEAARIKRTGDSVNVLLGDDFVAEIKENGKNGHTG